MGKSRANGFFEFVSNHKHELIAIHKTDKASELVKHASKYWSGLHKDVKAQYLARAELKIDRGSGWNYLTDLDPLFLINPTSYINNLDPTFHLDFCDQTGFNYTQKSSI